MANLVENEIENHSNTKVYEVTNFHFLKVYQKDKKGIENKIRNNSKKNLVSSYMLYNR